MSETVKWRVSLLSNLMDKYGGAYTIMTSAGGMRDLPEGSVMIFVVEGDTPWTLSQFRGIEGELEFIIDHPAADSHEVELFEACLKEINNGSAKKHRRKFLGS